MSKWKQVKCKNCQLQNIVDIDVRHKDPANGEENPLSKYCTFCQHPLEVEENMYGVFVDYETDCMHKPLKFIGTEKECHHYACTMQRRENCAIEELVPGEFET